jgi:hypothetical protein
MEQSQQVLEWQAQRELRVRREDLRTLLQHRFGPIPEPLQQRIEATNNPQQLQKAFGEALNVQRLDDLQL